MDSKGRVKVGIIGSGFEADIHAESFRIMPDEAEVVAVASPTPGHGAALAAKSGPRRFTVDVNAGRLPAKHWTLDPRQGGGRIVGEACHFVDLLRFLAGAPVSVKPVA